MSGAQQQRSGGVGEQPAGAQRLGAEGLLAAAALVNLPAPPPAEAGAEATQDGVADRREALPAVGMGGVGMAEAELALGMAEQNQYENEGAMQSWAPPAQTPADGSRMQPPDSRQVFHARNGTHAAPPAREVPYAGSEKGRYDKLQQIGVVAGEWKPEEDAALLAIVAAEGPGAWSTKSKTLGAATGYRSSTALRKRYNRLAGIEGPARSSGSREPQKRKLPPEFDNVGAFASEIYSMMNGSCKGCVPRSKSKHTCGKQYSPATAARRYGADYASREYGSDGTILQNWHVTGDEADLTSQTDSQLPSCAACQRQRRRCVHKVDVMMPGPLLGLPLPPETKRSSRVFRQSCPTGECDFCRRREGGKTLRTGCGCRDSFRGFAGYAHVSCVVKAAEKDQQIMHDCPKCTQRWQGELAIELARYNRTSSATGPKGARRPEDPECVRATVDLVATLCIAAVKDQNVE